MTTAGKVFSVLSFLMGIVFLVLVTPVAQKLIETQQQIDAAEKRLPGAIESAARLDSERVRLTYDLSRIKQKVTDLVTRTSNQADVVRARLAVFTDLEKAEQTAIVTWQDTVRDIQSEIDARTEERRLLEENIAMTTRERDERQQQVQMLTRQLAETTAALEATLTENLKRYEEIDRQLAELETNEPRQVASEP